MCRNLFRFVIFSCVFYLGNCSKAIAQISSFHPFVECDYSINGVDSNGYSGNLGLRYNNLFFSIGLGLYSVTSDPQPNLMHPELIRTSGPNIREYFYSIEGGY